MKKSVNVAVTGGAGNIGYAILPRLLSGEVFGPETKVNLRLLEIPPAMKAAEGVLMELDDCAFPLCESLSAHDDPRNAFDGVNWALLIGSKPRSKGMERGDLIRTNGPIFTGQGEALSSKAASDVRVVVVGNPANTNCMIAMHNAKDIPNERFSALTMLDHNRAVAQLAKKAGVGMDSVTNLTIWGNHSATQYPDVDNALINGKPVTDVIGHTGWLRGDFISTVQKRGAAIIEARGQSSAMSAANATVDHVKHFLNATPADDWFSAAVAADGSYGIDKNLLFSFPIRSDGKGGYEIVQDLPWNDFAKEKIDATHNELREERAVVQDLL